MSVHISKKTKVRSIEIILAIFLATLPAVAFASGIQDGISEALSVVMSLFAWITGAMGVLMANVLFQTVVRMGSFVHSLSSIQVAWSVFRDIGNILLVFGFIFIGIATILDNASYGAKKALPKLLIVALALNFSLFVTEFIIDTGNMFATQFYTEINSGKALSSNFNVSDEPISAAIMNALGLTKLYNFKTNTVNTNLSSATTNSDSKVSTNQNYWYITFFAAIILFSVTAFVLGTIAIMLVTRFVVLIFLLIVSPIGFIGFADIPVISAYGKKWWKALIDQTLFAPVLLLLLLVVVKLIQGNTILGITNSGSLTGNGVSGIANMLFGFAVVIGLLISALVIAKSLSGKAASFSTKWSGRLIGGAVGGVVGGGARAFRGASRLTGDNKFSRAVGHITRPIERFNFDPRRIPGMKIAGVGPSENMSYRQSTKNIKKYAPIVGEEGFVKNAIKENLREVDEENRISKEKSERKSVKNTVDKISEARGRNLNKEAYDKIVAPLNETLSKALAGMSIKEISELDGIKKDPEVIVANLSPEKFKAMMDSDNILDTQKAQLSKARYSSADNAVATLATAKQGSKEYKQASIVVHNMPNTDIENAPQELLTNTSFLKNLSDDQATKLSKSNNLSGAQKTVLKNARSARFDTEKEAQSVINSMKLDQIAKLSDDVITKPHVLKSLSFYQLKGLLDNPNNLSNTARDAIISHVRAEMHSDTPKGRQLMNIATSDPTTLARWGV